MHRRALSIAAFAAAALLGACCFPGASDLPAGDMRAHPAAGGRGYGGRRQGRWILLEYWTGPAPAIADEDEKRATKPSPERGAARSGPQGGPDDTARAGIRIGFPGGAREAPADRARSVLIREGGSAFLALARGQPVPAFHLSGRRFGGGGEPVDRGFEVSPRLLAEGEIGLTLTPAFVGIEPGESSLEERPTGRRPELRVDDLASTVAVGDGHTVVVSLRQGSGDEAMQALFGAASPWPGGAAPENVSVGAQPPAMALWFRVKVVR